MNLTTFFGGGRNHSPLSGNLTLKPGWPRLHNLDPDAVGRETILPDATKLPLGVHHFILLNISASLSVAVKDAGGATIVTLAAQEGAIFGLTQNTTAAGRWCIHKRSL